MRTLADVRVGDELLCEGQGMCDEMVVTVTLVTARRVHAGGMIFEKEDGIQVSSRPWQLRRRIQPMPEKSPV